MTTVPGANVWTVDDDGVQCPNAEFEHIQEAVEYASPWDTIVVCPGVYDESSTPVNSELNPVLAEGEKDGLTINKPLKIIGAGANKVTIKPATDADHARRCHRHPARRRRQRGHRVTSVARLDRIRRGVRRYLGREDRIRFHHG